MTYLCGKLFIRIDAYQPERTVLQIRSP